MEYMATGLPFVAFDIRETGQLAGAAAAYAPVLDTEAFAHLVDDLLDDSRRRAQMGCLGQRLVREGVAWECQRERYLASLCDIDTGALTPTGVQS
jgi:glycosyltransferase involved in cell wall biosynthesis